MHEMVLFAEDMARLACIMPVFAFRERIGVLKKRYKKWAFHKRRKNLCNS